jgi:hypothetical protein
MPYCSIWVYSIERDGRRKYFTIVSLIEEKEIQIQGKKERDYECIHMYEIERANTIACKHKQCIKIINIVYLIIKDEDEGEDDSKIVS